jgi:4-amino-4-deoxy-L-arabinose transferase-like glycosyltransferase
MTGSRRRSVGIVGVIVAAGCAARLAAYTGQSFSWGSDESRYLGVVQNMANGYFPNGDSEWFGTRLGLLWPVAGLFRLLHPSDVIAAIWPLAMSLTGIGAAYLLGRDLASRRVGFVAAAIVAVAPLEALVATRLRPDAIVPAFAGFAVWCALRAGRTGPWTVRWALLAGILIGAAWSTRENALIVVPILVAAGWRAGRRGLIAGALGAAAIPALASAVFAVGTGEPLRPLIGAGTEGVFRNPIDAFSWTDTYVATLGRATFDPGSPFFLLAIALVGAGVTLLLRCDRRALLPGLWLAWIALYLEFGTLLNLAKPVRYLTLCTIPCALLIALAIDGRLAVLAPAGVAVAAILSLWSLPGRALRADDSMLVARVADRLRGLPEGPILAESYTWYAKLNTYAARRRLTIPTVRDPEFLPPEQARRERLLRPLPDVSAKRGYVVTGPIHPRAGWPTNWRPVQSRVAAIDLGTLELVATIGPAMIWRWPNP